MGYTIKQKISICLKAESSPEMTQAGLASWAQEEFKTTKPPSQTTISRILCDKDNIISSNDVDLEKIRRRKRTNPMVRTIVTEWVTQAIWERIPITSLLLQLAAYAVWIRLPIPEKDGHGIFSQKWCNNLLKKLNIDISGSRESDEGLQKYPLNKIWNLDEKVELKEHLENLIKKENYRPQDVFTIDEFQFFYSLPLDQIYDVSSIDRGLKQSASSTENSVTIMLGTNIDASEKLTPIVVGKYEKVDFSKSSDESLRNFTKEATSKQAIGNKISEVYKIFYKSNINKWITSSMFENYLLMLNHKLASVSRKILIILDDSSSHRIINLNFSHIRLIFLKNNSSSKNLCGSGSGIKFDYVPMNYGITEEFKVLYRIQQYLSLVTLQELLSGSTCTGQSNNLSAVDLSNHKGLLSKGASNNMLSESEYNIPMIRAIEWIQKAWSSISQEQIFASWKATNLINFKKCWPSLDETLLREATELIRKLNNQISGYDFKQNHCNLTRVMGSLNVVLPWTLDGLLSLVNERGKVTANYLSIEEIIGSCLLEAFYYDDDRDSDQRKKDLLVDVDDIGFFPYPIFTSRMDEDLVEENFSVNNESNPSGNGIVQDFLMKSPVYRSNEDHGSQDVTEINFADDNCFQTPTNTEFVPNNQTNFFLSENSGTSAMEKNSLFESPQIFDNAPSNKLNLKHRIDQSPKDKNKRQSLHPMESTTENQRGDPTTFLPLSNFIQGSNVFAPFNVVHSPRNRAKVYDSVIHNDSKDKFKCEVIDTINRLLLLSKASQGSFHLSAQTTEELTKNLNDFISEYK